MRARPVIGPQLLDRTLRAAASFAASEHDVVGCHLPPFLVLGRDGADTLHPSVVECWLDPAPHGAPLVAEADTLVAAIESVVPAHVAAWGATAAVLGLVGVDLHDDARVDGLYVDEEEITPHAARRLYLLGADACGAVVAARTASAWTDKGTGGPLEWLRIEGAHLVGSLIPEALQQALIQSRLARYRQ